MSIVAKSLNAVTTNATGTVVQYDTPKNEFTVQVNVTGFTAGNMILKGSLDGINFYNLGGSSVGELPSGGFFRAGMSPDAGYIYTRVDFINASGTGALTALVSAA